LHRKDITGEQLTTNDDNLKDDTSSVDITSVCACVCTYACARVQYCTQHCMMKCSPLLSARLCDMIMGSTCN